MILTKVKIDVLGNSKNFIILISSIWQKETDQIYVGYHHFWTAPVFCTDWEKVRWSAGIPCERIPAPDNHRKKQYLQ